jgi:hypothetical protein
LNFLHWSGAMTLICTFARAAILALALPSAALSQPAPAPRTVDSTHSTELSAEKQERVREFVRQHARIKGAEPLKTEDGTFTPGMQVPSAIALTALPEDRTTEVPQVTTYQFFLAANGIVMVDPTTRRVVQVIPGS